MNTPKPLSAADIAHARDLLSGGNIQGAYQFLESQGYRYAT